MSTLSEGIEVEVDETAGAPWVEWLCLADQLTPRLWAMARARCATSRAATIVCQLVWLRFETAVRNEPMPADPDEWLTEALLQAAAESTCRVAPCASVRETEMPEESREAGC